MSAVSKSKPLIFLTRVTEDCRGLPSALGVLHGNIKTLWMAGQGAVSQYSSIVHSHCSGDANTVGLLCAIYATELKVSAGNPKCAGDLIAQS